jgi:hypothetical protein
MTQEEILEYNKECALFMGLAIITDGISFFDTNYKALKRYDFDWNAIMEVVEKIKTEISIGEYKFNMCPEEQSWDYQLFIEDNEVNKILHLTIFCEKKTVVEAINQFLIFYNENNK